VAQQDAANLVWVDLEMTGLEPERHCIIQAAIAITDSKLNVLDTASSYIWQPDDQLAQMSPFVSEMHTKSGLLARVRTAKTDLRDAEKQFMNVVARWCPYPATLCGNSIWQDRRFIDKYMPAFAGYLHYRMVDVSAIKVLAQRWYGDEALYNKPKDGEHDAVFDIKNSIDELRHYRRTLFQAK
jgi:oligoribonuclease